VGLLTGLREFGRRSRGKRVEVMKRLQEGEDY